MDFQKRKFEIKPKQFDIFDNIPNTENGKRKTLRVNICTIFNYLHWYLRSLRSYQVEKS